MAGGTEADHWLERHMSRPGHIALDRRLPARVTRQGRASETESQTQPSSRKHDAHIEA
jgi:hypothetical protein